MGKNVLITGVNGFLGRNLSSHLVQDGFSVFGIVRENSQIHPGNGVTYEVGDLLNSDSLGEIIRKTRPDIIFHFAALSRVGHSFANPAPFLEVNIIGTVNLLEAVRIHAPGCRIIFASSSEVYGHTVPLSPGGEDRRIPVLIESQEIFPVNSPYSISKICGEYLMECYAHSYDLDTVIVRSFNIEGVGRGDDFATAWICRQAASLRENPQAGFFIGNMAVFRDFTHIADAVRAYATVASKGSSGSRYNLGSMEVTSLASFLLYATESAGFRVQEVRFPSGESVPDPLREVSYEGTGHRVITALDSLLIRRMELVNPESGNIMVITDTADIPITVEKERFRPTENPVMIADTTRMTGLGYTPRFSAKQIADELVQFYKKMEPD